MTTNDIPVIYVDHGLGNNFGDHIEINENLKAYPELHKHILDHEKSHTSAKGFNMKDLMVDMRPSSISYSQLMKFMFKHPKSFTQLIPFYYSKGEIIYDNNMMLVWGLTIGVIGIAVVVSLI